MKLTDKDRVIIYRMIKYCDDISILMERYSSSFQRYVDDIAFQYSCGMCLIQIGELAGKVSAETVNSNTEIPWRAIKGMRNIHAHDYGSIDYAMVWNTLRDDIPDLKRKLSKILGV